MSAPMDIAPQVLHRRVDTIECWDDDPDFAELDQIQQPSTSSMSSRAGTDYGHRESAVSSRRSTITSNYDIDALEVADREHQIPFDGSPAAAIKSAQSAGIPIPENVPSSALVGGTIKLLGQSKRTRKVAMHDDWGEDLEFPTMGSALTVKKKEFPESLQQVPMSRGVRNISPSRVNLAYVSAASSQLNRFRDTPEDENIFGEFDDLPALKVFTRPLAYGGKPAAPSLPTPPLSTKRSPSVDDDFENDFEIPADAPLHLGLKSCERLRGAEILHGIDMGFEDWGDGDSGLGSSYAGTRGGTEHGPHSIISPSISAMTMESEDDMPLEGLILPDGVLPDFHRVLERRRKAAAVTPTDSNPDFHVQLDDDDPANEEFFEGIEIGEGEVFDSRKLSLNRNVRQKQVRKPSPVRRTAMSLTFTTNKPTPPSGRNSRLTQGHPTLLPSAPLEPVAERENQPTVKRNSRNRWSGGPTVTDYRWSANESYGRYIPPPPPIPKSRAERQRNLGSKSTRNLRAENNAPPTTTHAQLLRAKRSIPNIAKDTQSQQKNQQKNSRPPSGASSGRPSSRNSVGRPPNAGRPTSNNSNTAKPTSSSNSGGRPTSSGSRPPSSGGRPPSRTSSGRPPSRNEQHSSRPKTPHNSVGVVRHPAPFLPGGSSVKNSHHVAAKASKHSLDGGTDRRPGSRLQHRTTPRHSPSSSGTSNTTKKGTPTVAPEHLRREAASIGTLTQPTRKRNFGDGTELETFDDLPTSAKLENRFTVAPVARGAPKVLRQKGLSSNRESESPKKKKQDVTPRQDDIPRFARDTNASRKAREFTQQRLGLTAPVPPSPNADRWRSKIAARNQTTPRAHTRKNSQRKPHLIKPMGSINTLPKEAAANGMTYNPHTFRWEGNDRDLRAFETLENRTPPRPALITKVNQSGSKMGIQVVGGMVFDPSRMCWLKVDEDPEDEGDPFEGLEDLPEDLMSIDGQSVAGVQTVSNSVVMGGLGSAFGGRISGGFGEFVVGEEFDVGPEFVRRQREEEEKWRRGTDGWISIDMMANMDNRYLLRKLLAEP